MLLLSLSCTVHIYSTRLNDQNQHELFARLTPHFLNGMVASTFFNSFLFYFPPHQKHHSPHESSTSRHHERGYRTHTGGLSTQQTANRLHISSAAAGRIRKDNQKHLPVTKVGARPKALSATTIQYVRLGLKLGTLRSTKEARQEANKDLVNHPVSIIIIRRHVNQVKKRVSFGGKTIAK